MSYPTGYMPPPPPPQKRGMPWWGWLLILIGGGTLLVCAGVIGFVSYIGAAGPGTKVYVANEVPAKYLKTVKDLGLVEEGEQIKFLYSDAMTDIKEGVYVVTDRKVATYVSGAAQPLTKVAFTDIAEVEMDDGSGMFEDSSITLTLKDDSVVSFPLSTESKRDKQVLEAIRKAVQSNKNNKSATRAATKKA